MRPLAVPRPGHFLSAADLDGRAIAELLDHALYLKGRPYAPGPPLAGRAVAVLFEKPSLRTRVSFELGISRLGGTPIVLQGAEVGLGTREAAADVARTLERYVDAIVARVFHHEDLESMAGAVSIPVVNALSELEHPCQALADLLTLREHLGGLHGRRLVFIGDGNNVCASLLLAGAATGLHVRVIAPVGYQPDTLIVEHARRLARSTGSRIEIGHDPAGVAGADAVYTDVWASMGQEAEAEPRRHAFAPYAVTSALLRVAPDALVMHCLPAHRGEEIEADVIDGPRSIVFDQAENRLWVQEAVLVRLVTAGRSSLVGQEPLPLPLAPSTAA